MKVNIANKNTTAKLIEYRFISNADLGNRLLSFLMDVCVMLSPIMIWNILILTILGSMLTVKVLMVMNIIVAALLIISIFFFNSMIMARTHGQSLGMQLFQFRVISQTGKIANQKQIRMRELIGFDIPFVVLMIFTNIFGVAVYWILNGLVVVFDKKHRSIVDFLTKTMMVAVTPSAKDKVTVVSNANEEEQIRQPKPIPTQAPVELNHIDLHIHSNFSASGEYNVEDIFQLAKKKGIRTISLTDLDTAKSNTLAMRMSELYHVNYIPGIEINAQLQGKRVRILGYFIDYNNDIFVTLENESLLAEKTASIERVHKFEQLLGKDIDIQYLLENNRFQKIPGDMIARYVLKRKEYHDCEILQPYLQRNISQPDRMMSKDFFSYGKPCYVAVKYPSVKDVLDVISLCNGIPVLAHPGKLLNQTPELVDEIVRLGIQGIEVFHPMHTNNEMAKLLRMAKENKLFVTCGSGFYRENRGVSMGQCACPLEAESLVDMFIKTKL